MANAWPAQRRLGASIVAALLAGCAPVLSDLGAAPENAPPGPRPVRYEVEVDATLAHLEAEVCFEGEPPPRLAPLRAGSVPGLRWARGPEGRALPTGPDGVSLSGMGPGSCLRYAVDLRVASQASRRAARTEGELLLPQEAWLLRPSAPPTLGSLGFRLPEGMRAATPWPSDATGRLLLDAGAFTRMAPVAFGAFSESAIEEAGTRFAITRLAGPLALDAATLERGIANAARAVSAVTGRFPAREVRVFVLPIGPGDRPVAFGHVTRGGGVAILLLVHSNAEPDAFVADWTATHELSHLLLPRLVPEAAWMGEGIATYYQEVLRARVGAQRPEDAWRRLCEGFARGRTVGTGRPLPDEAATMAETFAFWRVYWSGAAFALEADVALRARGAGSLDAAVARLEGRSDASARALSGAELARALDGDGEPVIAPIARRYERLRALPPIEEVLGRLGVACAPDGVRFDDASPLAPVRDAIMGAAPSPESSR